MTDIYFLRYLGPQPLDGSIRTLMSDLAQLGDSVFYGSFYQKGAEE